MGGERQKAGLLIFAKGGSSIHFYSDVTGRCMEVLMDF